MAKQDDSDLCTLNYYIRSGSGINPCPVLYPRALHLDGSNWLIKRSLFPHAAFARWQAEAGGERNLRYWLRRVHPEEVESTLAQAAFAMRLRLNEAVESLRKSVADATTKINEADAEGRYKDRDKQIKVREGAVKRCRELLADLEKAGKQYGLDTSAMNHVRIFEFTRALERAQYVQTKEIAALADACIGSELEEAARNDEVPPEILADYVEERGGEVSAARAALGQTHEAPTPVLVPPAPETPDADATYAIRPEGELR